MLPGQTIPAVSSASYQVLFIRSQSLGQRLRTRRPAVFAFFLPHCRPSPKTATNPMTSRRKSVVSISEAGPVVASEVVAEEEPSKTAKNATANLHASLENLDDLNGVAPKPSPSATEKPQQRDDYGDSVVATDSFDDEEATQLETVDGSFTRRSTEEPKPKDVEAAKLSQQANLSSNDMGPPPDGGYGWVVVLGCFLIHCFVFSAQYSFGVWQRCVFNTLRHTQPFCSDDRLMSDLGLIVEFVDTTSTPTTLVKSHRRPWRSLDLWQQLAAQRLGRYRAEQRICSTQDSWCFLEAAFALWLFVFLFSKPKSTISSTFFLTSSSLLPQSTVHSRELLNTAVATLLDARIPLRRRTIVCLFSVPRKHSSMVTLYPHDTLYLKRKSTKSYTFIPWFSTSRTLGYATTFSRNPLRSPSSFLERFDKKRGLAIGLSVAGTGIGGLAFSPLTQTMITNLGVAWALRIQGIIMGVVVTFCAAILRTRSKPMRRKSVTNSNAPKTKLFDFSFFKNWQFTRMWITQFIGEGGDRIARHYSGWPTLILSSSFHSKGFFGYFSPFFFGSTYAATKGLSQEQGAIIVAMTNLGGTLGRIIVGVNFRDQRHSELSATNILTVFFPLVDRKRLFRAL